MILEKLACAFGAVAMTLAGAVVTLSSEGFAQSHRQLLTGSPRTQTVSYADLNLATPAGEKTLGQRVGSAVRFVCREPRWVGAPLQYQACRSFALRGARPQIERAVSRAHDIAANGKSDIPAVALTISGPKA